MKLCRKLLLTIGREYGSGEKIITEILSHDLNIPVFDKNLISMIAKKHGFDEAALASSDERLANPFFEPYTPYGTAESGTLAERLFIHQAEIIKEEANRGSAIFVGRCANDILRHYDDVISIFIFAPKAARIKRVMELEHISDAAAAEKDLRRVDKARRAYYQFYTDKRWGSPEGMDLLINSASAGPEAAAHTIEDYRRRRGYIED